VRAFNSLATRPGSRAIDGEAGGLPRDEPLASCFPDEREGFRSLFPASSEDIDGRAFTGERQSRRAPDSGSAAADENNATVK